jgi:hypothetical protein
VPVYCLQRGAAASGRRVSQGAAAFCVPRVRSVRQQDDIGGTEDNTDTHTEGGENVCQLHERLQPLRT